MSLSEPNSNSQRPRVECELCPEDQRVLDAMAELGFDMSALSMPEPSVTRRAQAINDLLGLMRDYPVEDADQSLIHATQARIDRFDQERAARMRFDAAAAADRGSGSRRRLALPNFISVAAVLLIVVSVMWPMMTSVRNRDMDLKCANNLRTAGYAFNQYAADFNNALPTSAAGLFAGLGGGLGGSGLRSPQVEADDARPALLSMQPLFDGGFCDAGRCTCPGHIHQLGGDGSSSFSRRLFVNGSQAAWNAGRVTVLIGDANPMIQAAHDGRRLPPLSMSVNHAGRGQNVLSSDGATLWLEAPVISRGGFATAPAGNPDNIWLPDGADELRSGVRPRDAMDVLLMH